MKSARAIRFVIGLVALLAMAWVHAIRPVRGFECDCGGTPAFTLQEHCHGPHSESCHDEDVEEPFHAHDGLPADGDTHHHTALIESLTALRADSFQFAAILAVAPVIFEAIALPPAVRTNESAPRNIAAHSDGRRWPQILSHSIALLI